LAMGILTIWWEQHHQGTALINLGISPIDRILIASRALWFYVGKLVLPINLTFSYSSWKVDAADPFQYIWLIACLFAIAGLWFWRRRLGRGVITAVLIFVAALSPMLGFFDLYTFVFTWVADHYQYMACIAIITLGISGGSLLLTKLGPHFLKLKWLISSALLSICMLLSWHQSQIYTDNETLWRDTLTKNPLSCIAENNLGQILYDQGKIEELVSHIKNALSLIENNPTLHPYTIASTHVNLALAYKSQNKYQEAITEFQLALNIFSSDPETHFLFGELLESQNRLDEAIAQYDQALQITPDDLMIQHHLASILLKKGDAVNAIRHLHRVLDIQPDHVEALNALVVSYIMATDPNIRQLTNAIEYAKRADFKSSHKNATIVNLLAMSYASNDQFLDAIVAGEDALKLATNANATDLANVIRKQLTFYKQNVNKK